MVTLLLHLSQTKNAIYRLSEKGVQTLVWQNQAKAWTPTPVSPPYLRRG
jgi:hypothetical protein